MAKSKARKKASSNKKRVVRRGLNRYGLSRSIPADVKFQVRKNSGFGCVICGSGIYQYEHIDPEFKNTRKHDPKCITLLCGRCHDKRTRKFLSVEAVKKAMESPKAIEAGFSKEILDIGGGYPTIEFANLSFKNVRNLLLINRESILTILPPEVEGAPFRINAKFTDLNGKQTLTINNNEWKASSKNWDCETKAGKIKIQQRDGANVLILTSKPPDHIIIESLLMSHQGVTIRGNATQLLVEGAGDNLNISIWGLRIENVENGINVGSKITIGY